MLDSIAPWAPAYLRRIHGIEIHGPDAISEKQVLTYDLRLNCIARGETNCSALLKIEVVGPIGATPEA